MLKMPQQNKEQSSQFKEKPEKIMSKEPAETLAELLLRSDTAFGRLAKEAGRRSGLLSELVQKLPEDLAGGLKACNIDAGDTLVILAGSPEWASRLRFEEQRILKIARESEPSVTHIKVRVASS